MSDMTMHFAAPPRRVPLSLRILNFFNGLSQIGWFVFGFGMIFFWVFASQADFSFITFPKSAARAVGKVTSVDETGASENRQRVLANHYEYSVAGRTLTGVSYASNVNTEPGQEVTVEYDEAKPERSRIAGMRRSMWSPWVVLVTIFPAIGFLFVYFSTRSGMRRNQLLRDGILTTGVLIRKEPTNTTVNNRRVWEYVFEFTDRNGQRQEATARSTDYNRLEDEPNEALLYDPANPSKAYVLDEAPSRPRLENGELVGRGPIAFAALIIPGIVILGHGLILLKKLGLW